MSERGTITVTVHEWDEDFDVPARDFINQLLGLMDTVPEQFRHLVQYEFDRTGDDYDYSRGEMLMYYIRPETDDEVRARIQAAQRSTTEQEAHERRERRELARLLAKYPKDE